LPAKASPIRIAKVIKGRSAFPCLYGGGSFVVGQRSSQLSVQMFSNLVETIFKFGAEKGVQWSRKSEETRAESV
jgi:NinB protein